jgi:hypothetical protein
MWLENKGEAKCNAFEIFGKSNWPFTYYTVCVHVQYMEIDREVERCILGSKVLSSKMDPAKIRLIRKVFIKERGAEVFRKIPVPHLVRAL